MKYLRFKYDGADAMVALFDKGRKQAHAYLTVSDSGVNAAEQINSLIKGASRLIADIGMRPVFKRYLLSDPANQTQYLPAKEECASSVLGQSPLDGTKASLLLILEDDAAFPCQTGGIWEDSKGRIWVGDCDDIATGDSQTMTVAYLDRPADMVSQRGAALKDIRLRT